MPVHSATDPELLARAMLAPDRLATVLADPDLTGLNSLLRLLPLGALETLLSPGAPSVSPGPAFAEAGNLV